MQNNRFHISYVVMLLSVLLTACPQSSTPPSPPAIPTSVSATAKDGYVLVDAVVASDATGANVYWSTTAGVTTGSTKVTAGSSPQAITGLNNGTTYYFRVTATNAAGESGLSSEVSATPLAATAAVDPLYGDQWHLKNTGQAGATGANGTAGQDLNVEPVWASNIPATTTPNKGNGVVVAVVDDGLEIGHEDLAANIAANSLSYNYVTGSNDPTNDTTDTTSGHGTAVAGIVAARDANGLGGRGVAPRASLVGYNLLQTTLSTNEADAMTRNAASIGVSSNSWGAPDGTGELDASTALWKSAIDTGLTTGRSGKGTIYTWAAGNGGTVYAGQCPYGCDSSNYDGRANYRGVIAVAAVNDQGVQSAYSEWGSNLLISAPGGEYCSTHTITTTDRTGALGFNKTGASPDYDSTKLNYTRCMNGTSSATPAISGVVALMLAANPNLGWRDVKMILAQTARKNDQTTSGKWEAGANGGYSYSHRYGFGVADAAAAVTAASSWTTNVGAEKVCDTTLTTDGRTIPDNTPAGISNSITVSGCSITTIEFIEVTFSASNTPYSGDLAVKLTSPSSTVSYLSFPHICPKGTNGACTSVYNGWVFGSARHLGESLVNGSWTLNASDWFAGDVGTFTSWKLKIYGH